MSIRYLFLVLLPGLAHADAIKELKDKVDNAAGYALVEIDKIKTNNKDASNYFGNGQSCTKAVDAAIAGGVPPATAMDYNFYAPAGVEKALPLSDIKAKICDVATAAEAGAAQKLKGADDAKYASFLSALSGDKKRIFREKNMLDGTDYCGPKGKRLKSPADFKAATSWYYWLHDRSGIVPKWEVEGWVWKGDKLLKTYDKKGSGEDVPDAAFK